MSKTAGYTLGEICTLVGGFMGLQPDQVKGVIVIVVDQDDHSRIAHNAPGLEMAALVLRVVAEAMESGHYG